MIDHDKLSQPLAVHRICEAMETLAQCTLESVIQHTPDPLLERELEQAIEHLANANIRSDELARCDDASLPPATGRPPPDGA